MELSGQQIRELKEALLNAFTVDTFQMMFKERLNKDLFHIAPVNANFSKILFDTIDAANREGWIDDLITRAREANPKNSKLYSFAQAIGLTPITTQQFQQLERLVKDSNQFLDSNQWLTALSRIENQVCRIEIETDQGKTLYGTGFLISSNALITNYHVMEALILGEAGQTTEDGFSAKSSNVKCRFDYKRLGNKVLNPGTVYQLDSNWQIDISPDSPLDKLSLIQTECLDYAIIRLAGDPGKELVASKSASSGESRGWIKLPENIVNDDFLPNSPLFIMQHPQGQPLKLALDTNAIIGLTDDKTRLKYKTNTEPGSSGSPCFNQKLELIALHHSGDPNFDYDHKPTYNEGIPFSAITALLRKRNINIDTNISNSKNTTNTTNEEKDGKSITLPSGNQSISPIENHIKSMNANQQTASNNPKIEYKQGQTITASVAFISIPDLKKLTIGVHVHELISILHSKIKDIISKHYNGVKVLSALTGAILVISDKLNIKPEPISLLDKIAQELNKLKIASRIGATHGDLSVLLDTDGALNFIGIPINIAARLCASESNNGILVHQSLFEHLLDIIDAEHWLVNQSPIEVKGKRDEKFTCYSAPVESWPICEKTGYTYTKSYSIKDTINASVISYDLPGFSDGDLNKLIQRFNSVVFAFQQTLSSEKLNEYGWNFYLSPGGDGGVFTFPQIDKEKAYDFAEKFAKKLEIQSKNKDESISVNCRIGIHYGAIALYQNAEEIMRPTGTHLFIADFITSDEAKKAGKLIFTEPLKEAVSSGDNQYFEVNFHPLSPLTVSGRTIKRYSSKIGNSNKGQTEPEPTKPDIIANQTTTTNPPTVKTVSSSTNNSLRPIWERRKAQLLIEIDAAYKQLGYPISEVEKTRINNQINDLQKELQDFENKLSNG